MLSKKGYIAKSNMSSINQDEKIADRNYAFTIDEALLKLGFGPFQYYVLFYAGMGWIAEAMEMMLLSFVGSAVQSKWNLSAQEESILTTVVFLGMLVGAYSWGLMSDKFGRRRGFLFTALVTSVAGLLSAFAPNYISLIIARGFVGLGAGGGHVLLSWCLEFIPSPNRGFWMVVFSGFWTVGAIAEAGLAWIVMPVWGWRWLLGLSSLPSFLLLVFYNRTPESPRYLCMKGRKLRAQKILETIAALNGKELPNGVLVSDHEYEMTELIDRSTSGEELSLISSTRTDLKGSPFSSMSMLFSPELMKSTILLWIVFFGNAFSYYGLVLLTTELNRKSNKCNPTISVHSEHEDLNYRDIFISSFAEFPGLILSAIIIDKLGRKISMAAMFFLACLFMLPLMVHQPSTLTQILLFGARTCITGTFTVVYIYAPEIYPTFMRSTGLGVASSIGRIGGMICPQVAVRMMQSCHQTAAIFLFGTIMLISGISVVLFPLETKGRQLDNMSSQNGASSGTPHTNQIALS